MAALTVPNRAEFVRPATAFLVQAARALDVPAAEEPVFEVAISEAVTNAVKHGSGAGPDSTITCELELENRRLTVRIFDDGEGFPLPKGDMPDVSRERIDALPASGYGLPIMQSVFSRISVVEVAGRFGLELALQF
jgi:anti-sigma regulatory factor (Ser/Thr protein kinase)